MSIIRLLSSFIIAIREKVLPLIFMDILQFKFFSSELTCLLNVRIILNIFNTVLRMMMIII